MTDTPAQPVAVYNRDFAELQWVRSARHRRPTFYLRMPVFLHPKPIMYATLASIRQRNDRRWQWTIRSDRMTRWNHANEQGTRATLDEAVAAIAAYLPDGVVSPTIPPIEV